MAFSETQQSLALKKLNIGTAKILKGKFSLLHKKVGSPIPVKGRGGPIVSDTPTIPAIAIPRPRPADSTRQFLRGTARFLSRRVNLGAVIESPSPIPRRSGSISRCDSHMG